MPARRVALLSLLAFVAGVSLTTAVWHGVVNRALAVQHDCAAILRLESLPRGPQVQAS